MNPADHYARQSPQKRTAERFANSVANIRPSGFTII
jgi:hypothetical protein